MPSRVDRTNGEVDWPPQFDRTPAAERVNSSPDTIEEHYDKEDPRRELEERRRAHIDSLALDDTNDE